MATKLLGNFIFISNESFFYEPNTNFPSLHLRFAYLLAATITTPVEPQLLSPVDLTPYVQVLIFTGLLLCIQVISVLIASSPN